MSAFSCQLVLASSSVAGAVFAAGRSLPAMKLAFALMAAINAGFTKTEARRASWRPRSDSRFSLADSESGAAAIRPAWATMGKPGRSTTDSRFDPIVCSQAASNRSVLGFRARQVARRRQRHARRASKAGERCRCVRATTRTRRPGRPAFRPSTDDRGSASTPSRRQIPRQRRRAPAHDEAAVVHLLPHG